MARLWTFRPSLSTQFPADTPRASASYVGTGFSLYWGEQQLCRNSAYMSELLEPRYLARSILIARARKKGGTRQIVSFAWRASGIPPS